MIESHYADVTGICLGSFVLLQAGPWPSPEVLLRAVARLDDVTRREREEDAGPLLRESAAEGWWVLNNGTVLIRHQCRKTAVLSCHRFLISSGV